MRGRWNLSIGGKIQEYYYLPRGNLKKVKNSAAKNILSIYDLISNINTCGYTRRRVWEKLRKESRKWRNFCSFTSPPAAGY